MVLNPVCSYPNVRKAALDIYEAISSPKSKKYTARPYNRYAPENSLWWLIPSTEWPAYKHGKVAISEEQKGEMFFGINIEKAIGREAAACYQSKKAQKLIMDSEWCWYDFLKSLEEGEIAHAMNTIQESTNGLPLHFSLSGHVVDDPALFDPYSGHAYGDQVVWHYEEGDLNSLTQPENFFYPLKAVDKISDLAEVISQISELHWLWIDVYVGVIIENRVELKDDEVRRAYEGYSIWQKFIEPWEPWLK
jgi:hypothetical protein